MVVYRFSAKVMVAKFSKQQIDYQIYSIYVTIDKTLKQ